MNLDKPAGASSARLVARVKRLLPRGTKIGHAGTLDPFATGVLLLLVGKATKSCEALMDAPKQYEAVVRFGATTETDDPELARDAVGARRRRPSRPRPRGSRGGPAGLRRRSPAAPARLQRPEGRRPAGVRPGPQRPGVVAGTPPVRVYGIELLEYAWPLLTLRIDCGRGTYIRSIARDLGRSLDVGGHLAELRRTRVGASASSGR